MYNLFYEIDEYNFVLLKFFLINVNLCLRVSFSSLGIWIIFVSDFCTVNCFNVYQHYREPQATVNGLKYGCRVPEFIGGDDSNLDCHPPRHSC